MNRYRIRVLEDYPASAGICDGIRPVLACPSSTTYWLFSSVVWRCIGHGDSYLIGAVHGLLGTVGLDEMATSRGWHGVGLRICEIAPCFVVVHLLTGASSVGVSPPIASSTLSLRDYSDILPGVCSNRTLSIFTIATRLGIMHSQTHGILIACGRRCVGFDTRDAPGPCRGCTPASRRCERFLHRIAQSAYVGVWRVVGPAAR